MHALPGDLTTRLIDDLVRSNYGVVENAVEPTLVAALRECAAEHRFRPAGVGKAGINDPSIRNDEISWIDEKDLRPAEQRLFEFLEALRQRLNEELFLGLEDFEAHFASYESGHFYSRHVDRFADESARTISIVVYLNETWTEEDGGQLRLHATPPVDVLPLGGTLVCFTSDAVEHEVLPARRARLSIAAWLRRSRARLR